MTALHRFIYYPTLKDNNLNPIERWVAFLILDVCRAIASIFTLSLISVNFPAVREIDIMLDIQQKKQTKAAKLIDGNLS